MNPVNPAATSTSTTPATTTTATINPIVRRVPLVLIVVAIVAMLIYGPISQPKGYHQFADQITLFGIPHAADVFTNIGFAVVGIVGWLMLAPHRTHPALAAGWFGYRLFALSLLLTAFGSAYYHWAPDNARLVWDRIPIALACAGLLAAVRAETVGNTNVVRDALRLSAFAIASVLWWIITDARGQDDLRPYLLLQLAPLVLIPIWQTIYRAPTQDRLWFGAALLLYVFAKATEVLDHQIHAVIGLLSGHNIKHLLATAAAGAIVWRLSQRVAPGRRG